MAFVQYLRNVHSVNRENKYSWVYKRDCLQVAEETKEGEFYSSNGLSRLFGLKSDYLKLGVHTIKKQMNIEPFETPEKGEEPRLFKAEMYGLFNNWAGNHQRSGAAIEHDPLYTRPFRIEPSTNVYIGWTWEFNRGLSAAKENVVKINVDKQEPVYRNPRNHVEECICTRVKSEAKTSEELLALCKDIKKVQGIVHGCMFARDELRYDEIENIIDPHSGL